MKDTIQHEPAPLDHKDGEIVLRWPYAQSAWESFWNDNRTRLTQELTGLEADECEDRLKLLIQEAFGSGWATMARERKENVGG